MEEVWKKKKKGRKEEEKASLGAVTITQDKEDQMWEDSKSLKIQPWCINTGEHEQWVRNATERRKWTETRNLDQGTLLHSPQEWENSKRSHHLHKL